jgi:hypothetical protein
MNNESFVETLQRLAEALEQHVKINPESVVALSRHFHIHLGVMFVVVFMIAGFQSRSRLSGCRRNGQVTARQARYG